MSQEFSPPDGPPRGSTSIDQIMEQTGAEPSATPDEIPPELTGRKSRKGRKAAKAALSPKKQLSGFRGLFAACFAVVLATSVLVIDEVGPSVDRSARITERYRERKSKGGTNYVLEGVDEKGGEFEIDVSKSAHNRASVGDRVVVTRSVLTGRVIVVDGPGWSDGRSPWKLWVSAIFGGIALALLVWTVRLTSKNVLPNATPDERRSHFLRLGLWGAGAIVGVTGWVLYERADANADAGGGQSGTVTTAAPVTPDGECDALAEQVERWMFTVVSDGVADTADLDHVVAIVQGFDATCAHDDTVSAVCDEFERLALPSAQPLVLEPATLCVGR